MNLKALLLISCLLLTISIFLYGLARYWIEFWGEEATTIKRRLEVIAGDLRVNRSSLLKIRRLSQYVYYEKALKAIPKIEHIDTFLTQSGSTLDVGTFLNRSAILIVCSFMLLTFSTASIYFRCFTSMAPFLIWILVLQHQRKSRISLIETQLPDILDLMARAMQAGHAFSSALLIVGSEGPKPIRQEFQTTFDEINFGIATETALHNLYVRVESRDLRFFIVATLIQLETGGNLTEILKSLANLIRDRQRISGSIRVLSAEGRLSAWILGCLPFLIGSILYFVNPDFISKLWTEKLGIQMLEISMGLMVLGIWWMWRMVKIRI